MGNKSSIQSGKAPHQRDSFWLERATELMVLYPTMRERYEKIAEEARRQMERTGKVSEVLRGIKK